MPAPYPLDSTGLSPANLVADEVHVLTEVNASTYRILIPVLAPFYLDNFALKHIDSLGVVTTLMPDLDFYFCLPYIGASRSIGKMLYGAVSINTQLLDGHLRMTYQTIGGEWIGDPAFVRERLAEYVYNPRTTIWDIVTNKANQFPPINHAHDVDVFYGQKELVDAVNALSLQIAGTPSSAVPVIGHLVNLDNPHEVTKEQVGLGQVTNLPLATNQEVQGKAAVDKYVTLSQLLTYPIVNPVVVSGLEQAAVQQLAALELHVGDSGNPHQVSKEQVGLGSVDNLPLATDQEVQNKAPVDKYVTLKQIVTYPIADPAVLADLGEASLSQLAALQTHIDDSDNPHEVTKAQVGLSEVANLPLATNQEVQSKTAVDKYVTLKQLVAHPIVDPVVVAGLEQASQDQLTSLQAHVEDSANPHEVTKEQVGLGAVVNLPLATDQEVQNKAAVDKYVTLKQIVLHPITDPVVIAGLEQTSQTQLLALQAHVEDSGNPHEVTKEQVGLGAVMNLPMATDQEVQDKASVDKYVTLKQLVAYPIIDVSLIIDLEQAATLQLAALEDHVSSTANPHQVTKGQIGLGDVDNTADSAKPVSTAQAAANEAVQTAAASDASTKAGAAQAAAIAASAPVSHVGAGGAAHATATVNAAGFMSAADKARLDALSGGVTTITIGRAPVLTAASYYFMR